MSVDGNIVSMHKNTVSVLGEPLFVKTDIVPIHTYIVST